MNPAWILAGAAIYGAATVWGVASVVSPRRFGERALRGWVAAGLVLLTCLLLSTAIQERQRLVGDLRGVFLVLAWLVAAISLGFSGRSGLPALLPFAAPMVCLLQVAAALAPEKAWEAQGAVMVLHAGSSLLGYAAFATAFLTGLIYLAQERALRGKGSWDLLERLPPLETLDLWNCRAAGWGFPFMTVSMATGILIAVQRGGGLHRDPVVVGSAVSWLLFGALLAGRHVLRMAGRRISLLAVAAFGVGLLSLCAGLIFGGSH